MNRSKRNSSFVIWNMTFTFVFLCTASGISYAQTAIVKDEAIKGPTTSERAAPSTQPQGANTEERLRNLEEEVRQQKQILRELRDIIADQRRLIEGLSAQANDGKAANSDYVAVKATAVSDTPSQNQTSPLEDRVNAVAAVLPDRVRYAANVTGPVDSLLQRARRAVELGAGAVMVNAFAQGLDSLRALREAQLGVPIFAHRVGAALWGRERRFGVAPAVIAQITRLCGADYVQVGSFTGSVYDTDDDVRAQIDACHRPLGKLHRSVAVIGGGVGPRNARAQVEAAGVSSGLMVLLGSAAYDVSPEDAVLATVESVRPNSAAESA